MVSLNQRQALAGLCENDRNLKRFQLLLDGADVKCDVNEGEVRELLFAAIASANATQFKELALNIGQRRISADSDWCNDDYLLFLLLLGNEKFGRPLKFLPEVIEARRNNPNQIPRKINEIFAALNRQEFGINGEFSFFKIPFLKLIGKLHLDATAARIALQAMSEPGLFDCLPPFLKLLMLKAYDLVLTEREPLPTETTVQLISAFEEHSKNLSLRQWWRIISALPGRLVFGIVATVLGLGLIPFIFGLGKGLAEHLNHDEPRLRPSTLGISGFHATNLNLPNEAVALARTLSPSASNASKHSLIIAVDSEPLAEATPPFILEVSQAEKPILNAFAYTHSPGSGPGLFTIVPVERDTGRFRALLPKEAKGEVVSFVLAFDVDTNETLETVGKSIIFRPLQ